MEHSLNKTVHACAKVNLYLDILGKDSEDGYHYIDSIFQEISLSDTITMTSSSRDEVIFSPVSVEGDTTVHQALHRFKQSFGVSESYRIHVQKKIPMGAGLGGGSSDAAAVLRTLAEHHNIPLTALSSLAADIGMDVPFFLTGGIARVRGKGENVTPLESRLENVTFLVCYPDIHVSTPWAYSLITEYGEGSGIAGFLKLSQLKFDFLADSVYNRFQHFTLNSLHSLEGIKERLDDWTDTGLSFMSGSGSSLVYVYKEREQAVKDKMLIETKVDFPLYICEPVYR